MQRRKITVQAIPGYFCMQKALQETLPPAGWFPRLQLIGDLLV